MLWNLKSKGGLLLLLNALLIVCFIYIGQFGIGHVLVTLGIQVGGYYFFYYVMVKRKRQLPFQIYIICMIGIGICILRYTQCNYPISYTKWLRDLLKAPIPIEGFQIGTIILLESVILLGFGLKRGIVEEVRRRIDFWIPPMWVIIITSLFVITYKSNLGHISKFMGAVACIACLVMATLSKYSYDEDKDMTYMVSGHAYITHFSIVTLVLVAVIYYLPNQINLPGSDWLYTQVDEKISKQVNIAEGIPYTSSIVKRVDPSKEIIFEVETDEPLYLREIAYNHYKDNEWSIPEGEAFFMPLKTSYFEAEYAQTSWILEQMEWLREKDPTLFLEYDYIWNYKPAEIEEKEFYIAKGPENSNNYMTVNGVSGIYSEVERSVFYYYDLENIYFHRQKEGEEMSYKVTYYDRVPPVGTREYIFLKSMSPLNWAPLLQQIEKWTTWYGFDKEPTPKLLENYTPMEQYKRAYDNFIEVPKELQEPLTDLGEEIVGYNWSEWDKALAIENYLKKNGGFHYNRLKYKDNETEDNIYEFLFETKEGICQDFASSMTLLCRSIGLPARYVTGYSVTEENTKKGVYVVRKKDAHAFVEVYITGYGWMQFDPTPSNSRMRIMNYLTPKNITILFSLIMIFIAIIYGLLVAGRYLLEYNWKYRILKRDGHKAIEGILKRTLQHLQAEGFIKNTEETLTQYKERLQKHGIDLSYIINLFEKSKYGLTMPTPEEIEEALRSYIVLKRSLGQISKDKRGISRLFNR